MSARHLLLSMLAGASFALSLSNAATAQSYPQRPVKLIVSLVAGSPADLVARSIADKLSAKLKQTFVVENRPGAHGNLASEFVARSAPDGHTLLFSLSTTQTVNPSVYKKLPFDPDGDLRHLSIVAITSTMLVVHPSVPVNSVPELVALARREPMAYAHGGHGSPGHLTMEYFRLEAGFPAIPVPYRGNAPLVNDLVAGQIKLGFVGTGGVIQHVRAGRLRGLAISKGVRSPLAPDVPTVAELGYPGFKVEPYYLMSAPAGIPDPIAALLERELQQAVQSPDLQEKFRANDTEPAGTTGADATARIKADRELWARVVKATGMTVE
jgi:tripartite-type tricarboxylate transporter receptor subunit TctC